MHTGRRWTLPSGICALALLVAFLMPDVGRAEARELPPWAIEPSSVYFQETGHHLSEPFLSFWRANGDRAIFGLPISEPIASNNGNITTQYFERMTLQYRPGSGGATALVVDQEAITNSSVNLRSGPGTDWGRVGVLRLEQRLRVIAGPAPDPGGAPWYQVAGGFGTGWVKAEYLNRYNAPVTILTTTIDLDNPRTGELPFQRLPALVIGAIGPDTENLVYFPRTGHTLTGRFLAFWEQNGGALVLGLPLSEPFREASAPDGKTYLVQYFEHARMEYHPEAAEQKDQVQLSVLGRQAAAVARVNTGAVSRRADSPIYNPSLFNGPKWIEVDLNEQRLTAYEGALPILTTLIRSGRKGWETPTGTFRTYRKVPIEDMTLLDPSDPDYYYTPNVPWIMYFLEGGFALHGALLDDMWGTPTSHGCINIPIDLAAYLYDWAPLGTIVWIHH